MSTAIRTPQANIDVALIWSYIAQDNVPAADRWMAKVDDAVALLVRFPLAGKRRPRLMINLRAFPVGNYVIFYRPCSDGIELLRVLHGARRIGRRLFD